MLRRHLHSVIIRQNVKSNLMLKINAKHFVENQMLWIRTKIKEIAQNNAHFVNVPVIISKIVAKEHVNNAVLCLDVQVNEVRVRHIGIVVDKRGAIDADGRAQERSDGAAIAGEASLVISVEDIPMKQDC